MRLEDVPVDLMRTALDLYVAEAFGAEGPVRSTGIPWEDCQSATDVLDHFSDDTGDHTMRKFTLRLGNQRYPFMKVVFQELLLRDRFFFAVDTHDELDIKKSFADYEKWLEIKRFNSDIKERVERAWKEHQVPTFATIVAEVEAQTPQAAEPREKLILIVENEPDIARGVTTILERSGYRTVWVSSGEEALDVLEEIQPDLILSDLEMDGMTGLELAATLRKMDGPQVPFILATAATVGSSNFVVIDGYLVKPFDTDVLLKFVNQHLEAKRES